MGSQRSDLQDSLNCKVHPMSNIADFQHWLNHWNKPGSTQSGQLSRRNHILRLVLILVYFTEIILNSLHVTSKTAFLSAGVTIETKWKCFQGQFSWNCEVSHCVLSSATMKTRIQEPEKSWPEGSTIYLIVAFISYYRSCWHSSFFLCVGLFVDNWSPWVSLTFSEGSVGWKMKSLTVGLVAILAINQ